MTMLTLLANFLRQEPDRALFLRPTLNYFFARLWFTNRPLFWEIFWTLLSCRGATGSPRRTGAAARDRRRRDAIT